MKKSYRIIGGIIYILFYIFFLYEMWHLCQYGGIQSHTFALRISSLGAILSGILLQRIRRDKRFDKRFFRCGLAVCLIATLWFGGLIIYAAIPYHGALSWKIQRIMAESNADRMNDNSADQEETIQEPPEVTAQEIAQETAKETGEWTIDRTDEAMYFFLDDNIGWRLVVTDAAAGSRSYAIEKCTDGGLGWDRMNQNLFGENIGVTEGLVFFDENFGFAGLTGPSQSHSKMYITRDGGLTFTQLQLPMDTVTEIPVFWENYSPAIEEFDYVEMPQKEGDVLFIKVLTEGIEVKGIVFQSKDNGETWEYIGAEQSEKYYSEEQAP